MDINEIKTYIESNKDSDDVKEFIGGFQQPADEKAIIDKYRASVDFKKEQLTEGDRRVTQAIDKFQKETMPKHIEAEIKKRFPDETPEQKALREMKAELDTIRTEKRREEIKNKALQALASKKLDASLTEFITADDDDQLSAKVEKLNDIFKATIEKAVNDRLKISGSNPPASGEKLPDGVITDIETVRKMQAENPDGLSVAIRKGLVRIPGLDLSERIRKGA